MLKAAALSPAKTMGDLLTLFAYPLPCATGDLTSTFARALWGACGIFNIKSLRELAHDGLDIKNARHLRCRANVLVIRLGFEPKTHSLEGCCSIQLSYRTGHFCKVDANIVLFVEMTKIILFWLILLGVAVISGCSVILPESESRRMRAVQDYRMKTCDS